MSTNTPANPSEQLSVRDLLKKDAYRRRFEEIMGGPRAGQFMASVVQASNSYALRQCDANSVIAAAVVAASLDLPIDKNLGFAHIVPYKGVASFQMGYKGFIQLALRSGQFKSMRDARVNVEAFAGFDPITGDPKIDWPKLDETKPPVGYAFAWRLTNGFEKLIYWRREDVEAHAQRFSQAYRAKKKDSPWFTDFDTMALKTVIKSALAKWAPLSLQMQQAVIHDEGAQKDVGGEIAYFDNDTKGGDDDVRKPLFGDQAGATTPPPEGKAPEADKKKEKPAPADEKIIDALKTAILDTGSTELKAWRAALDLKLVPENVSDLYELPGPVMLQLIAVLRSPGPTKA